MAKQGYCGFCNVRWVWGINRAINTHYGQLCPVCNNVLRTTTWARKCPAHELCDRLQERPLTREDEIRIKRYNRRGIPLAGERISK